MLPLFSSSNSDATLPKHPVKSSAHLPPPCHLPALAASFSCSCVLAPLCMLHILCCHFADISIYYFLLLLRFTTRPSPTLVLSLAVLIRLQIFADIATLCCFTLLFVVQISSKFDEFCFILLFIASVKFTTCSHGHLFWLRICFKRENYLAAR